MIKWSGFGKLLKRSCFILLISCFILLGNYSSSLYIGSGLDLYGTVVNPGGIFITNVGNNNNPIYKSFIVAGFNGGGFFRNNGNLYCFMQNSNSNPNIILQGIVNKYGVCNNYKSNGNYLDCSYLNDYTFYDYNENDIGLYLKYLDNNGEDNYSNSRLDINGITSPTLKLEEFENKEGIIFVCATGYINNGNLIQNYNGYSSLNDSYMGNPPGYTPSGSLDGSNPGDFQDFYTGDYVYSTCTYGDIINYYESQGMSKYLCYGGIDNWDFYNPDITYNPEPGTGLSIVSITSYSSNWSSPRDWFDYWNGLYVNTNASQTFVGRPAVYHTFLDLYYIYGGNSFDFDSVYKYCGLKVFNINTSTVYTGSMFSKECKNIQIQKSSSSSSGENVVGLNFGSGQKTYTDGTVFITDFFNLLKSNLVVGYGDSFGFLPTYIIMFLLAIILFRFISH